MTLDPPHNFAGQSVELYQHFEGPLGLSKEVPEYGNSPGVRCMDLVLGAECGGPYLVQPSCIHRPQTISDGRVVTLKHLHDSEVPVGSYPPCFTALYFRYC